MSLKLCGGKVTVVYSGIVVGLAAAVVAVAVVLVLSSWSLCLCCIPSFCFSISCSSKT